ncbi:MAG: hypothetical protein WBA68_10395 [Alteraurantiacibacter sp.]
MTNQTSYGYSALPLIGAVLCFVLSGCGLVSDGDPIAQTERTEKTGAVTVQSAGADVRPILTESDSDCLVVVWDKQPSPDREFDRSHDLVEGGTISCATGTSPSEYEASIKTIREAARQNDRVALLEATGIPLLFIDDAGLRSDVAEPDDMDARFDDIFTSEMLAVLRDLQLEDMTVVPDQGGYFALGSLWLVAREPGGRPYLVTVNRQALAEAGAAEHDSAAEASLSRQ